MFGSEFLDITPKAQSMKEKLISCLIKIKNVCAVKDIKRMKRQAKPGENTCKTHI